MKRKMILSMMVTVSILLVQAAENVKIPDIAVDVENQPTKGSVSFPLLEKKPGRIPVLKARIFYDRPVGRGWNNAMQLFLNNRKLTGKTLSGKVRLLRREALKATVEKEPRKWYGNPGWLVMFGSGSGEVDSRIQNNREEGFWYYFDISDTVNYTGSQKAKENQLLVGCLLRLKSVNNINTPLTLKDIEIVYLDEAEADQMRK
ncbi:MAG: hypothetical protein J5858_09135 [Lentisphaeria bacterium]|nr:hypothetical protein [Lentisphaeria bacterium]